MLHLVVQNLQTEMQKIKESSMGEDCIADKSFKMKLACLMVMMSNPEWVMI